MVAATAAETDYPARPVRVIVPYPAGGGADTVSRILLAKLSDGLGQQFVIENRGGAGGTIGAAVAAKAERDGYTVLYDATAFSVNPSLYARLPYDTLNDFQPVFLASLVPNLLVVHPSVEAKTVEDVIAIAKAAPGGLDWASSGNGTVQHLSLELFRLRAGVKLNHIPYRGGGPALNDLIGGTGEILFRQRCGIDRTRPERRVARHRAYRTGAAAHAAGDSSRCGDAAGVRGLRMERRLRTCRNALPRSSPSSMRA